VATIAHIIATGMAQQQRMGGGGGGGAPVGGGGRRINNDCQPTIQMQQEQRHFGSELCSLMSSETPNRIQYAEEHFIVQHVQ
jgi:hypothetical protein